MNIGHSSLTEGAAVPIRAFHGETVPCSFEIRDFAKYWRACLQHFSVLSSEDKCCPHHNWSSSFEVLLFRYNSHWWKPYSRGFYWQNLFFIPFPVTMLQYIKNIISLYQEENMKDMQKRLIHETRELINMYVEMSLFIDSKYGTLSLHQDFCQEFPSNKGLFDKYYLDWSDIFGSMVRQDLKFYFLQERESTV